MERITGIEPAYSAWEADILPLNHIRMIPIINLNALKINTENGLVNQPEFTSPFCLIKSFFAA